MKITKISVNGLNGYLNRLIPWKSGLACQVIYGGNGSGKTSILTAIYHLLSTEDSSGHRTYLANLEFKKIAVSFDDNHTVSALRLDSNTGSYSLKVSLGRKVIYKIELKSLKRDETEDESSPYAIGGDLGLLREIYKYIEDQTNGIMYMPDDRAYIKSDSIRSSMVSSGGSRRRMYMNYMKLENRMSRSKNIEVREMQDFQLNAISELASGNLEDKISDAILGSAEKTDNVYLSVVKQIAKGKEQSSDVDVLERLKRLREDFEGLRGSHAERLAVFEKELNNASGQNRTLMYKVLLPYVESTEKRLIALKNVYQLINIVIEEFNRYFTDKKISYHERSGFTVFHRGGEIPLTSLSSGERQLLFIFFSIIATRSDNSIIMIDEPEISLNVSWQRLLPGTIERLANAKGMQVIMASHSIEMIAQMPKAAIGIIK